MITQKEKEIQKAYNKRAASVDPGEGHRLLGPNEVLKRGDECLTTRRGGDSWSQTEQPGDKAGREHSSLVYRRREDPAPEPGEGYRLLSPDELIREGDEWLLGVTWRAADTSCGLTPAKLNQWRRERSLLGGTRYYRRKVASPVINADGVTTKPVGTDDLKKRPNPLWQSAPYTASFFRFLFDGERNAEFITLLREHLTKREDSAQDTVDIFVKPGAGYRLLSEGDVIRATDEFIDYHQPEEGWKTTGCVGNKYRTKKFNKFPHFPHRRNIEQERKDFIKENPPAPKTCEEVVVERIRDKFHKHLSETVTPIAPGEGYRTLQPGEKLQFGDECWDVHSLTFKPVPLSAMGAVTKERAHFVRRKVDTAVQRELADLRQKVAIQDNLVRTQSAYIKNLKIERNALRDSLSTISTKVEGLMLRARPSKWRDYLREINDAARKANS